MSTSSYPIYDTLPDASDHLRLLTVHAGSISVPIRCTLRTVNFRDKPSYDALSYAWGDSACTKPIDVDGSEIQITVNLEQALRHLRDVEHDLVLWVDAICINQSDASEKSHQVAFMGDIYRECDQVRIWLGCDSSKCNLTRSSLHTSNATDESHGALDPFELVCHLADGGHIRDWPCFLTQSDHGSSTIAYKANDLFDNIMEAFRPVIQSSWWTRMWTVQEAILPNKGLLTYDTWSTSLQTITDCGRSANGQWPGCCRDAFMKLPEEYFNALQGFFGITNSIYLGRERNDVRDVVRHSLHRQHFEYGYRGCKDPRDKVYALLGIVNDVSLKPSYICSTDEVFLRATCHTLFYEKSSLKSLTGALYGPATGKCASWVCQFDAPFDRLYTFVASNRHVAYDSSLFDASSGRKSKPVLLGGQPQSSTSKANRMGLELRGIKVGSVSFISQETFSAYTRARTVLRQWTQDALDWSAIDVATNTQIDDEPSRNGSKHLGCFVRFCRMLLGGIKHRMQDALSWDATDIATNTQTHDDSSGNGSEYPDSYARFWRTLLGGTDVPRSSYAANWTRFIPATMDRLDEFLSSMKSGASVSRDLDLAISTAEFGRCYFKADNSG
ncbi:unnamed protein product [Alternaria alternata]